MKLSDMEIIQAFTDAIGGVAIALSRQLDSAQLVDDLNALGEEAEIAGKGPTAGLVYEIARTVESRAARK
jgi:hypothetical protein